MIRSINKIKLNLIYYVCFLQDNYVNTTPASNGTEPTVSPGAAAAAAVAAVAQGLRQQMCSMVAAAQHQSSSHDTNPVASLVNSLAFAGHMQPSNGAMGHAGIRGLVSSPAEDLRMTSPAESALDSPLSSPLGLTMTGGLDQGLNLGRDLSRELGRDLSRELGRDLNRDIGRDMNRDMSRDINRDLNRGADMTRDLSRELSRDLSRDLSRELSRDFSRDLGGSIGRDLGRDLGLSPNVEVGIGVSGMTYKPPRAYSTPRPENLFQEDIDEIVKPLQLTSPPSLVLKEHPGSKEPSGGVPIKVEPMTECRGE